MAAEALGMPSGNDGAGLRCLPVWRPIRDLRRLPEFCSPRGRSSRCWIALVTGQVLSFNIYKQGKGSVLDWMLSSENSQRRSWLQP
jgi:hypothetical protein